MFTPVNRNFISRKVRTKRIHSGPEALTIAAEAAEVAVGALNRALAVSAGHTFAHILVEAFLLFRPLEETRTACGSLYRANDY